MNKRVLQSSIVMVLLLLAFQYVLKIFFPQEFVLVISNPYIIAFGEFVDKHIALREILYFVTALITYYLFLCAVCKKWGLSRKEFIIIVIVVILVQTITFFDSDFSMILSIMGMLGLAYFLKAEFKLSIILFAVHGVAQVLSIKIRGLAFLLPNINFATILCLALDCYLWLLLFYFYCNYKKGDK